MHIPDGFLDPKLSSGLAGAAALVLAYCLSKVSQAVTAVVPAAALATAGAGFSSVNVGARKVITSFGKNLILRTCAVAGLIISLQMFDFRILSGTPVHFLGGALAAILLGPFAGGLAMGGAILIQAMMFGDGGITALGANLINMAFIGTFLAYYVYSFLKPRFGEEAGIAAAAWFSVVASALVFILELSLPLSALKVYFLLGLGEAAVTLGLVQLFRLFNLEKE
jgi:cobalt/nickel transport system permease protein